MSGKPQRRGLPRGQGNPSGNPDGDPSGNPASNPASDPAKSNTSTGNGLPIRTPQKDQSQGQPQDRPQGTGKKEYELLANFFTVDLGNVSTIYQYPIDDIVKVKPIKSTTAPAHHPLHPKRAPLPKGLQASSIPEKQEKTKQDEVYRKKFKQPAPPDDPGQNDATSATLKLPKRIRRRLIFLLCDKLRADGVKVAIASDYNNYLLTVEPIKHEKVPGIVRVAYYDEDEGHADPNLREFEIVIGPVKETQVRALLAKMRDMFPSSAGDDSSNISSLSALPALLNPFFSHCANVNTRREIGREPSVTSIGSNKFYRLNWQHPGQGDNPPWPLKTDETPDNIGGLSAIPGFFRSTRASIGSNLLLNINTTTSAFYQPGNLLDILQRFGFGSGKSDRDINAFLKGLRVRTTYLQQSASAKKKALELHGAGAIPREHIYTVRGLPFHDYTPTAANVYFEYFPEGEDKPKEVCVEQYWQLKDKHQIKLARDDLIIECGRGCFIPAKFLEVLPGQNYKNKTDMVKQACRLPHLNYSSIMGNGMSIFGITGNPQTTLASRFSGLTVQQSMVQVPVVRLPFNQLAYGNRKVPEHNLSRGRWNLAGAKASSAAAKKQYAVYAIRRSGTRGITGRFADNFSDFCKRLKTEMANFGLSLEALEGPAREHEIWLTAQKGQRSVSDEQTLRTEFLSVKTYGVSLVILLLPDNDAELYAQIKRAGDVGAGLHTVCHVAPFRPKTDVNTLANLAMKVNLKLDRKAANQVLQKPLTNKLLVGRPMIVGIDVTHPAPNSTEGAHSVAAVVSSVDENFAQYPASLRANPRTAADNKLSAEQVVNLAAMMRERLTDFRTMRKALPDRLLIYRDGLSEGQFDLCKNSELRQIKRAVSDIYTPAEVPEPKILLVCSVKRHHARFFDAGSASKDILDNNKRPVPGVAVFKTITYGQDKDFFLVSHETIIGTTRPCHYIVLHNELDVSIAEVADATHQLCYLFGRATRSVSVVTPSYYADLAADRARHYVRQWYMPRGDTVFNAQAFADALQVHPEIQNSMFYI